MRLMGMCMYWYMVGLITLFCKNTADDLLPPLNFTRLYVFFFTRDFSLSRSPAIPLAPRVLCVHDFIFTENYACLYDSICTPQNPERTSW
jgi:hypothetical protein